MEYNKVTIGSSTSTWVWVFLNIPHQRLSPALPYVSLDLEEKYVSTMLQHHRWKYISQIKLYFTDGTLSPGKPCLTLWIRHVKKPTCLPVSSCLLNKFLPGINRKWADKPKAHQADSDRFQIFVFLVGNGVICWGLHAINMQVIDGNKNLSPAIGSM